MKERKGGTLKFGDFKESKPTVVFTEGGGYLEFPDGRQNQRLSYQPLKKGIWWVFFCSFFPLFLFSLMLPSLSLSLLFLFLFSFFLFSFHI